MNSSIAYQAQTSTKGSASFKKTVDSQNQNIDFSNFMEQYDIKGKKGTTKKTCSVAIKCDTSKIVKARRY